MFFIMFALLQSFYIINNIANMNNKIIQKHYI